MADNQSIIGKGAIFKGKISNASTIEINGKWYYPAIIDTAIHYTRLSQCARIARSARQSLSLHLTFTGHARLGARTQAR